MKKLLLLLLLVTLMSHTFIYAEDNVAATMQEPAPIEYAEDGLPVDLAPHSREYILTNNIVISGLLTFRDTGLYFNTEPITSELRSSLSNQIQSTFSMEVEEGYKKIHNKEANLLSDYIVLGVWGESLANLTSYRQSGYSAEKYVILPTSPTTAYLLNVADSDTESVGRYIDNTLMPLIEHILKEYTITLVTPSFNKNGESTYTTKITETVVPYTDTVSVYNIGREFGLKLNSRYTFILTSALQENGVYTQVNNSFEYMYRFVPHYVLKRDVTKEPITTLDLQLVEYNGSASGYDVFTTSKVTYTPGSLVFVPTGIQLDQTAVVPYQLDNEPVYIQSVYRELMRYGSGTIFTFEDVLDLRPIILGETTKVNVTDGSVEFDTYVSEDNAVRTESTDSVNFDIYIVNKKMSTERFVTHILTKGKQSLSQRELDTILDDLHKRYKTQNKEAEWVALLAKHGIKVSRGNAAINIILVLLLVGVVVTGVLLVLKKRKTAKIPKEGVLINVVDEE